jgi:hypothetical protein
MPPLFVISVLFGLSLLAAWVLFNVLKSTATVSKPEYQLGGAAAGFVVILTLLGGIYIKVNDTTAQETISALTVQRDEAVADAKKGSACLEEQAAEVTFSGVVTPSLPDANVVLGVSEVQLQQDGRFAIKAHHVKPADLPYIYVIGADSHAPYRPIFATDDPGKLTIPH